VTLKLKTNRNYTVYERSCPLLNVRRFTLKFDYFSQLYFLKQKILFSFRHKDLATLRGYLLYGGNDDMLLGILSAISTRYILAIIISTVIFKAFLGHRKFAKLV